MLKDFLAYTCTIQRPTISNSWGEQTKTFTTIYTNISCRYYISSWRLKNTDQASETKNNSFNVILEPDKTNIQIWDTVTVSWVPRKFIVEDFKQQKVFSMTDHIALYLKQE